MAGVRRPVCCEIPNVPSGSDPALARTPVHAESHLTPFLDRWVPRGVLESTPRVDSSVPTPPREDPMELEAKLGARTPRYAQCQVPHTLSGPKAGGLGEVGVVEKVEACGGPAIA